jgi:hypothetical protein
MDMVTITFTASSSLMSPFVLLASWERARDQPKMWPLEILHKKAAKKSKFKFKPPFLA